MSSEYNCVRYLTAPGWESAEREFRAAARVDLTLNPNNSPKHRQALALVVTAWNSSRKRLAERDDREAKRKAAEEEPRARGPEQLRTARLRQQQLR